MRQQAEELEQRECYAESISALLWRHIDDWENEGGYCVSNKS